MQVEKKKSRNKIQNLPTKDDTVPSPQNKMIFNKFVYFTNK